MEAYIREVPAKPTFKPFEFVIKVKDISDLAELWLRLNLNIRAIIEATGPPGSYEVITGLVDIDRGNMNTWKLLDNRLDQYKEEDC